MRENPRPQIHPVLQMLHACLHLTEQQAKRAERAEQERDDARAVARAILQMAQEQTGRQFVSDHVLERHPWLKEGEE